MTNLTDEGLRVSINKIVDSVHDAYESASSNHHNIEEWEEEDWQLVNDAEYKAKESMLALVQQVRDAAKKEERERCAKVAENMDTSERDNARSAKSHADNIATAIRQMDGGK